MSKREDKKIKAFVASFFTIIGFLIAILIWKKDNYVMYYAKHGLILFIGQLIIILIKPFITNWFIYLFWIFWFILWILTWLNAISGEKKSTPIITDLADKINV